MSWLIYIYFFVSTAIAFVITVPLVLLTFFFDSERRLLHYATAIWMRHYYLLNPLWRITIKGREHLRDDNCIYVANHQSVTDIFVVYVLVRRFKWVAKQWIFKLPFLGWNLILGRHIRLDDHTIERCRYWLKRGVPLMLFPEGTRSEDGELLPFKDGAFRMSVDLNLPVIPIVIKGAHELLPKGSRKLSLSGEIEVVVMPPRKPGDYDFNHELMRDSIRDDMKETLAEMRGTRVLSL